MLQLVLERKVCEHVTSWMVSLLRRLGYRRAILQSDGESTFVALESTTLSAVAFSNYFSVKA